MWVLIFYCMYDEVYAWLTNSWYFYPLLILILLIGGSYITGTFEIPLKILSYFTGLIA